MFEQVTYKGLARRNIWAGDTIEKLKLAHAERKKINDLIVDIESHCNHTFVDGETALEAKYDPDDGRYFVCSACHIRTT